MKVFKDNVCYVDYLDLVRYPVPSYFILNKICYEKNEMVIITDYLSINYVRKRTDILDYAEVSNLSNEELKRKYEESKNKLDRYAKRMLDTPRESQRRLYNDKDFINNYKYYKYRTNALIDYLNNKEEIDKRINEQINIDDCKEKKLVK